jgi:hypothetical protein
MPLNYPAMKALVAAAALSVPHAVGFDAGVPVPTQPSTALSSSALDPQWSSQPTSSIMDDPLLSGSTLPGQLGTRVYITRDMRTGQTYHRSAPITTGPLMTNIPQTYYIDKLVILPSGAMQASGPKLVMLPNGAMQHSGPDKTFTWKHPGATPMSNATRAQLASAAAADAKPDK